MPEEFDAAYWEGRYSGHATVWSGEPNPQLVAEAAGLTPGSALDAGCGEGADAIWLAQRGWRVTAMDFAATALRRAREHAASQGEDVAARIDWVQADLRDWTPPADQFDLVSSHYVHLTGSPDALFRRLASAVAPGGALLVVGHHPSGAHAMPEHASLPPAQFTAEQVAASLDPDGWDIVVADARTRPATHAHGGLTVLHDAILLARKRA